MPKEFENVIIRSGDEIIKVRVPKGTPDDEIKAFISAPSESTMPVAPTNQGPLGLVPESFRKGIAEEVSKQSFLQRFAGQSGLPIGLAAGGGALGALTGPFAPVAIPVLAGVGGLAGELITEELGFSPTSRLNQVLAGISPGVGSLAGKTLQLGKKGIGFIAKKSPPFRAAESIAELEKFTKETGSIGAKILEKQQGLMGRESRILFRAARMAKAPLTADDLPSTRAALDLLETEAKDFKHFPEGQQILGVIEQIKGDLFPKAKVAMETTGIFDKFGAPITKTTMTSGKEVTTESLGRIRQLIGASIDRLQAQSGVRLGAAKKFFSGLADDMENLARSGGPAGPAAQLRIAAGKRAKLEFAVKDMEAIITKATKPMKGEGDTVVLNAKTVLDRLEQLTNPKSDLFDKNFASALKNELPEIKKFFQEINKLSPTTSPGGPASIVYRGATAKLGRNIALGAGLGFVVGDVTGGTIGAMIGATLPEMITALLLTPNGRKIMLKAAQAGSTPVNHLRNAVIGEIMGQAVSPKGPIRENLPVMP